MKVVTDATDGCIKFQPIDNKKSINWINITKIPDGGCYTYVGSYRPNTLFSLQSDCVEDYIIVHELLHTLGF